MGRPEGERAVEILRQDKLRSEANAALDRLERGALITLPRSERITKLGRDDCVQELGDSGQPRLSWQSEEDGRSKTDS